MKEVLGFWVLGLELGSGTRMGRVIRIYADFIVMFLERGLEKFEKFRVGIGYGLSVVGCLLSVLSNLGGVGFGVLGFGLWVVGLSSEL